MGHLIKNNRGSNVVKPAEPKTKASNKILLALQFWKGDRDQAMRMARYVADLAPEFSDQADFLFSARFDCPHDSETVKYVSRKFNVWTHQCRRRGVGWPHGCNELWFGTMAWIHSMIETLRMPHYKAVLTFEADCVPMRRDWLTHFHREWDRANEKKPTYVLGAKLMAPGEHINGNALFSTRLDFLRWLSKDIVSANSSAGWDYWLAPEFKQWGWAVMPNHLSYWNTKSLPEEVIEDLFRKDIVFLHGVKDDSVLDAARAKFAI
jgi:hypothetical protein